jgi:Flp pilus assembly protein TadD
MRKTADTFQNALALDDKNASIWGNLGTARYFQGRFLDAAEATEKAVSLNSGNYLYLDNLGDCYRWAEGFKYKAAGPYEKAISLVRKQLTLTPDDIIGRSRLAVYLAKSGKIDEAMGELVAVERDRA